MTFSGYDDEISMTADQIIEQDGDEEKSVILDVYGERIRKPRERIAFGFVR